VCEYNSIYDIKIIININNFKQKRINSSHEFLGRKALGEYQIQMKPDPVAKTTTIERKYYLIQKI